MIYKILLFTSVCLISFNSWSQSKKKLLKNAIYIDQYRNPSTKEKATYYVMRENVKKEKNYSIYIQKTFYLNGNLYDSCMVKYERNNPEKRSPYRIGKDASYFPNGNTKSEYSYENGEKKGEYSTYYMNGVIKSIGRIENYDKHFIYSYYDTLGNNLLFNGSGFFSVFDSSLNSLVFYEVKDSLVLLIYYIDEFYKDTIYQVIDNKFEPVQGMEILYQELTNTFNKYNFRKYIGHTIKVELIIFENGEIGRLNFINPITEKHTKIISTELKRILLFNPPMLKNGKQVKIIIGIPFKIV